MLIIQSPYMEIVWLAFFDGEVILKLPQKNFWCSNFVLLQAFRKLVFFCEHNVVPDTLKSDFSPFCLIIFFQKRDSYFLYGKFIYAMINVW